MRTTKGPLLQVTQIPLKSGVHHPPVALEVVGRSVTRMAMRRVRRVARAVARVVGVPPPLKQE